MKNFALVIALVISGSLSAQVSIQGGASMLAGFGNPRPFGGFHIGLEIPRDDAVSIFGRYTHHFKQVSQNPTLGYLTALESDQFGNYVLAPGDTYEDLVIDAYPSMNYHIIEGGTRYYLGNGFDYGFAAYGGTSLMLIFNKFKSEYEAFNEDYYEVDEDYRIDGSIFSIGFGLGGGMKYSTARMGTFYLDLGLSYMLFGQPSNAAVANEVNTNPNRMWSPLIFNFNIGYRKDIIW